MSKKRQHIYMAHSSHLDLYWIGTQNECLDIGANIIDDAVRLADKDSGFTFLIDTVRFLEYYLSKYPDNKQTVKRLFENGQFEIGVCYTDRLENHHDGESLVRNTTYGKKILNSLLGIETVVAYHPDLPGLAEQTPQIYRKAGVHYYLFARGFVRGGRFWWKGLDDSRIIAYNFPVHYSYYNIPKEIVPFLEEIKSSIQSEDILLSCSSGDLGPADTFVSRDEKGGWDRVALTNTIEELNRSYPELQFQMSGVTRILERMDHANLEERHGEYPSKWGVTGSATNVQLFHLDKRITSALLDAEKFSSIAELLGNPIEYGPQARNPLKHRGGSGGSRNYFELQQNPQNMPEWLQFAWRLQLITQDHNYAGINGVQSNFDRFRYKETALQVAENIRDMSLRAISSQTHAVNGSILVFNSMNWQRSETVTILPLGMDNETSYVAEDSEGNRYPLIPTNEGYAFLAQDVPSLGYKAFAVKEGNQPELCAKRTQVTEDRIYISNPFYEVVIDREAGTLKYVKDRETNKVIIDNALFLSLDVYEDLSDCVMEKIYNKVKRESSMDNVRSVTVVEDHLLWTKVEVITEIADSKAKLDIYIDHTKKEIRCKPTVYWIGQTHLQLNMNLFFPAEYKDIVYGVPYGVQRKGAYLHDESPWAPDEISPELYERYREVMGWFALQSDDTGIRVSSNHSAYDFADEFKQAVLIRNVPSCGDKDVLMPNNGKLEWEFRISTYRGDWETNEAYKSSWELQYPLLVRKKLADGETGARLPDRHSFVKTSGSGIVSVLKKSESDPNDYVMRIFNNTSRRSEFGMETSLPIRSMEACDLNEQPSEDSKERLGAFEIKTMKLLKDD